MLGAGPLSLDRLLGRASAPLTRAARTGAVQPSVSRSPEAITGRLTSVGWRSSSASGSSSRSASARPRQVVEARFSSPGPSRASQSRSTASPTGASRRSRSVAPCPASAFSAARVASQSSNHDTITPISGLQPPHHNFLKIFLT